MIQRNLDCWSKVINVNVCPAEHFPDTQFMAEVVLLKNHLFHLIGFDGHTLPAEQTSEFDSIHLKPSNLPNLSPQRFKVEIFQRQALHFLRRKHTKLKPPIMASAIADGSGALVMVP